MEIRYIGKTCQPTRRFREHQQAARRGRKNHRERWIGSLLDQGLAPEMIVLERLRPDADWETMERWWIAVGLWQGWRLTNGTDGGDCGPSNKGRPKSQSHREKIGVAHRGKKLSPEHIEKVASRHRGCKRPADSVRRMRITQSIDVRIAERILELYQSGVSCRRIAPMVGVSYGTAYRYAHQRHLAAETITA